MQIKKSVSKWFERFRKDVITCACKECLCKDLLKKPKITKIDTQIGLGVLLWGMGLQKFNIRLLGALIVIFAATHLFLNLCIISLPFILKPDELRELMRGLSQTFGPIAIQENRNGIVLSIKVMASLFLFYYLTRLKVKEQFK